MVYVLAVLLGIHLVLSILSLAGVVVMIVLSAAIFACFSMIIACLVKTRERFMGISQVLTMPLFFASSAIYPIALMPEWLRHVADLNPLTYQVDALRTLMLPGFHSDSGLLRDFAVQAGIFTILVLLAGRLYQTILE
jgi:ABC-2 type transport system permease protein